MLQWQASVNLLIVTVFIFCLSTSCHWTYDTTETLLRAILPIHCICCKSPFEGFFSVFSGIKLLSVSGIHVCLSLIINCQATHPNAKKQLHVQRIRDGRHTKCILLNSTEKDFHATCYMLDWLISDLFVQSVPLIGLLPYEALTLWLNLYFYLFFVVSF